MDKTKYEKGGSAGCRGVEFQVDLLTVFVLNAFRKLTNWKLSTENKDGGKFDDVVLEWSEGTTLLQAKYKENKKNITFGNLISANSKNDDFSLPKYFLSYQEIKKNFNVKNVIICTNAIMDGTTLTFLKHQKIDSKSMLYSKNDDWSFYTVTDNILPYLKENLKSYLEQNCRNKNFDESIINDDNLKDFLEHLQLYSNYPENIAEVIEQLLSQMRHSNILFGQVCPLEISAKVMEWFQQKKGTYLDEVHTEAIFSEIYTEQRWQILKQYEVYLQRNDLSFQLYRIFYVTANSGHILAEIKMYHALQFAIADTWYSAKNIFLYVSCYDEVMLQKQILTAFSLRKYIFLIVLWPNFEKKSAINGIYGILKDILNKYHYKKVIFVSDCYLELISHLGLVDYNYTIMDGSVAFGDMAERTQKKLIKKESLVFQGNSISLEELFAPQGTPYGDAVDTETLGKLVSDENILVGLEVAPLDYNIAPYYINRIFKRNITRMTNGSREVRTVEEIYFVNHICDESGKVVIISDGAGMGKSTVLAKLATMIKERNPHIWVIRLELYQYSRILKNLLQSNGTINIIELLDSVESTRLKTCLENNIFSLKGKVILMLDGLDEISPDYTDLIIKLIVQCRNASNIAKIFVTTRPHMTHKLKTTMNVEPFTLQPLTKQDQIEFLAKYWVFNLKLDNVDKDKCKQYAEYLLNKVQLHFNEEVNFTAVPLQVRMMAEIFQEGNRLKASTKWKGCKEYLCGNEATSQKVFDIAELYQMFIEKKRDVFLDKGNPSGNLAANQALSDKFNECLACYHTLALDLFPFEIRRELFLSHRETVKNMETIMLRIGIVQKFENAFHFTHRTFAEYFLAESLVMELQLGNQNAEFQKFIIERIFMAFHFNSVRAFIDCFLENVLDSLSPNIFQIYQTLEYDDHWRRNFNFHLIHILANEGHVSILRLLFKCVGFNIVQHKTINLAQIYNNIKVENRQHIFGNTLNILKNILRQGGVNITNETNRTPLDYAAQNGHLRMVKYLVAQGANINNENSSPCPALYMAVTKGHFDIVKFLIEQGANIEVEGDTLLQKALKENRMDIANYLFDIILQRSEIDPITPYAAAYLGQLNILRGLIENGMDVNNKLENGEALVFAAARGGRLEVIKYLIEKGADINSENETGNTALHAISSQPSLILIARFLVESGIDINRKNTKGETALHIATSSSVTDMVRMLTENDADINSVEENGKTALCLAASSGHLAIVKILIEHGADAKIKDNDGYTALHLAVLREHMDTVKLILEHGVDINITDRDGCSVLHCSALWGSLNIVQFLADLGVNIDSRDNSGRTALHSAAAAALSQQDTVEFLVELGADMTAKDNRGQTPLHLASRNAQLSIVNYFVKLGVDVNVKDTNGRTPLFEAVKSCNLDVVTYLVSCGAEVNIKDNCGCTSLFLVSWHSVSFTGNYADFFHLLNIISYLVKDCKSDVNVRNNSGRTVLHEAVSRNQLNVVMFLVEKFNVDVNIRDNNLQTPLHLAVEKGVDVVKFLIDNGADINVKDYNGDTPINLARTKGSAQLLEYLEADNIQTEAAATGTLTNFLCLRCKKK